MRFTLKKKNSGVPFGWEWFMFEKLHRSQGESWQRIPLRIGGRFEIPCLSSTSISTSSLFTCSVFHVFTLLYFLLYLLFLLYCFYTWLHDPLVRPLVFLTFPDRAARLPLLPVRLCFPLLERKINKIKDRVGGFAHVWSRNISRWGVNRSLANLRGCHVKKKLVLPGLE